MVGGTYAFSTVDAVVYNVFPTKTGQLVTGRVTDAAGNLLGSAVVTASYRSVMGTVTTNVATSASGLYAVLVDPAPAPGSNRHVLAVAGRPRPGWRLPRPCRRIAQIAW